MHNKTCIHLHRKQKNPLMLKAVIYTLALALVAHAKLAPWSRLPKNSVMAVADYPEVGANKYLKGYVFFTNPKAAGVKVHVDMTGLPPSGGPFYYHIHENTVTGDCDSAGPHFDPFGGLEVCPAQGDDAACQVGDLSGKHGWINTTCFQTEYADAHLSLDPESEAYIVGRSLVFHYANMTRFACANINLATKEQCANFGGFAAPSPALSGAPVQMVEVAPAPEAAPQLQPAAKLLDQDPGVSPAIPDSAANPEHVADASNPLQEPQASTTVQVILPTEILPEPASAPSATESMPAATTSTDLHITLHPSDTATITAHPSLSVHATTSRGTTLLLNNHTTSAAHATTTALSFVQEPHASNAAVPEQNLAVDASTGSLLMGALGTAMGLVLGFLF